MNVFLAFVFGLVFGSFLNAIIWRLHTRESIFRGRSKCPKCRHVLGAIDLIPLLSFFIRRGKCRYCGKSISWQYPLVELATAVLFAMAYGISNFQFPVSNLQLLNLLRMWFVIDVMIIIFVYDARYFLILDKVTYPAAIVVFLTSPLTYGGEISWQNIVMTLVAAAIGGGFFLFQYLISKGKWLGGGDVKMGILMGLILGLRGLFVALFLSYVIGAIVGLGLIAVRRKTMKSQIPFGTFLSAGTIIAMFWAEPILRWYFKY